MEKIVKELEQQSLQWISKSFPRLKKAWQSECEEHAHCFCQLLGFGYYEFLSSGQIVN
jgi:hypothetical protein